MQPGGGGAASGVKPWSAGLQSLTPAATAPPVSRPHDLGVQGCFSRVGARRVHRHRLRGNAAQDSSRTGRGLELPTPTDARGSRQEPPAARRGPTSCAQVASRPPGPMPLRLGISAEGSAPHAHTPVIRTHDKVNEKSKSLFVPGRWDHPQAWALGVVSFSHLPMATPQGRPPGPRSSSPPWTFGLVCLLPT